MQLLPLQQTTTMQLLHFMSKISMKNGHDNTFNVTRLKLHLFFCEIDIMIIFKMDSFNHLSKEYSHFNFNDDVM